MCIVEFTGHLFSDRDTTSSTGMGAGVNGNSQWQWEGNGNKTRLNLGLGMGMGINHWEWEDMELKRYLRSSLISIELDLLSLMLYSCVVIVRRVQLSYVPGRWRTLE